MARVKSSFPAGRLGKGVPETILYSDTEFAMLLHVCLKRRDRL